MKHQPHIVAPQHGVYIPLIPLKIWQCFQDKDDDSAFVRKDDSALVRNDDDSAFVKDHDSAIVRDEDSAFLGMIVNYPHLHHLGLNLQQ